MVALKKLKAFLCRRIASIKSIQREVLKTRVIMVQYEHASQPSFVQFASELEEAGELHYVYEHNHEPVKLAWMAVCIPMKM